MPLGHQPKRLALQGDGLTIVADSYGNPGARPVVFAHGGGQSRGAWSVTARIMADAGYHAVSLDLRGHGDSDWADDGDYAFEAYVRDFSAIIPQLGERAALIGASLGGRGALLMATTRTDLIGALVLADVTPRIDEDVAEDVRTFFHQSADGFVSLEDAAATLSALTTYGRPPQPERLRGNMREQDGRFFWRWDPRFVDDRFVKGPDQLSLLEEGAKSLVTPTLMIRAENSDVVREEHVAHFRSIAPHIETDVAPGIGHMLTGDANDAYAPMILEFLRRVYPPNR